jgi:hypothetical protein
MSARIGDLQQADLPRKSKPEALARGNRGKSLAGASGFYGDDLRELNATSTLALRASEELATFTGNCQGDQAHDTAA